METVKQVPVECRRAVWISGVVAGLLMALCIPTLIWSPLYSTNGIYQSTDHTDNGLWLLSEFKDGQLNLYCVSNGSSTNFHSFRYTMNRNIWSAYEESINRNYQIDFTNNSLLFIQYMDKNDPKGR